MRRIRFPLQLPLVRQCMTGEQQTWFIPLNGIDKDIKIYTCAARRAVPLILPNENYVSWYTCGPTVYDSTHLGHASCYVKLDIIQRILREHFQLNLVTAMNITDIDDKIIQKSEASGRDWSEMSKQYEHDFWSDLRKLNVTEPNLKLRVSEHIPQIIAFIEYILTKGFAYIGKDKSVYFDVKKFPVYGKLQKVNLENADNSSNAMELGTKHGAADFVLWKAQKYPTEPAWPSPWGPGRPGWHIECSALATLAFGHNLDFHAGGLDLKFPHHENEEAQSCVYHNTTQWVNYWLHTGQLNVKGQSEKMSKSLKNTISIDDMLTKYTADDFRMACILSNYRNSMDYSDALMETAKNTLNRFKSFTSDCRAYLAGKKQGSDLNASLIATNMNYAKAQVDACFKNDFDTARSISVLIDEISGISRGINATNTNIGLIQSSCLDTIAAADNFIQDILRLYGFQFAIDSNYLRAAAAEQNFNINALLEDILNSRKIIRDRAVATKNKELFQICDELRNCLQHHGIEIKDHNQGSTWSYTSIKK